MLIYTSLSWNDRQLYKHFGKAKESSTR